MTPSATDHAAVLACVDRLWREVAPDPERAISPHDDIFEHGADSFAFVTLVQRVQAELDVRIPLAEVFEDPRLDTITRLVLDAGGRAC